MTETLRWAIVAVWAPVLIWAIVSALPMLFGGRMRRGHPMRFICALVAVPFVGINLWWLMGWEVTWIYQVLLAAAAVAGLATLAAMFGYGLGEDVPHG